MPAIQEEQAESLEFHPPARPRRSAGKRGHQECPGGGPPPADLGGEAALGSPRRVVDDPKRAGEAVRLLEEGSRADRSRLIGWLLGVVPALALSKHGCWVVQKALEVASAPDRNNLVARLESSVTHLYRSRHGNFVLTRMIELVPSASIGFVVNALSGEALQVARHRFGCRALERLIAHCSETQLAGLVGELLEDVEGLATHAYGNFVVQALFEHGPLACREHLLGTLLPHVPRLASDRVGSHIVQKAIIWSGAEGQRSIVDVLLQAPSPNSLIDIACSRHGSFTVEELANVRICHKEVRAHLMDGLPRLLGSKNGERVIECFSLSQSPLVKGPSLTTLEEGRRAAVQAA